MKASHRRILRWLRDGSRVWCGFRSQMVWVSLPNGHPDGGYVRVRRATLREMEAVGLVVNLCGIENDGSEYSDSVWALATATK